MGAFLMRVGGGLLWSSLLLSVAVLAVWGVLRGLRVCSPGLHRVGYLAALLSGWAWVLALIGLPGVAVPLPRPFSQGSFASQASSAAGFEQTAEVGPAGLEATGASVGVLDGPDGRGESVAGHHRPAAESAVAFGRAFGPHGVDQPAMSVGQDAHIPSRPARFASGSAQAGDPPASAHPLLPNETSLARSNAGSQPEPAGLADAARTFGQQDRTGLERPGPAASPRRSESAVTRLVAAGTMIWFAGVWATVARWVGGYLVVAGRCRRAQAAPAEVCRMWNEILAAHGARREMPVVFDAQWGPALVRLVHGYMLVLPAEGWMRLSPGEQRAVLLHESAHWVRGDLCKSLAVRVLALAHWFKPLAWFAVRRFEAAAEWACDQRAVCGSTEARKRFVKAILALKSARVFSGWPSTASGSGDVLERVRRLAPDFSHGDPVMKRLAFLVAIMLVMGARLLRPAIPEPAVEVLAAEAVGPAANAESTTSSLTPETRAMAAAADPEAALAAKPKTSAEEAKSPIYPAARLKYKNQTFQEWLAKGEDLSLEVRCEVAKALAAFGANGMPQEAAEAILELLAGVNTWRLDSQQAGGKLAAQAIASLGGGPVEGSADASYVLPVSATMPVLLRFLRQGTPGQQYVVAEVLRRVRAQGADITPAVPDIRALLERHREAERRAGRVRLGPGVWGTAQGFEPALCSVLRDALLDADPSGKFAIEYLENLRKTAKLEIFCTEVEGFCPALGGLYHPVHSNLERPAMKSLRRYLLDLAKRSDPAESLAGIQGLARLGLHLYPAATTLIELFVNLDDRRQAAVLTTLQEFGEVTGFVLGKGGAMAAGFPPPLVIPGGVGGFGGPAMGYAGGYGVALPSIDEEAKRNLTATRAQIRQFAEQLAAKSPSAGIRQQSAKLAELSRD